MRVAIIPARGGSRRIPRKNIRQFHGKPIIAYSIEAAKASGVFDVVCVSTDDAEIAHVAMEYGAFVMQRPKRLAQDSVGTQEVMHDALNTLEDADVACCIYPCAPMLDPHDLQVIGREWITDALYVVPVGEWLSDPGMFYFGRASAFRCDLPLLGRYTRLYPVDRRRCCDINTEEDWMRAERMYSELIGETISTKQEKARPARSTQIAPSTCLGAYQR